MNSTDFVELASSGGCFTTGSTLGGGEGNEDTPLEEAEVSNRRVDCPSARVTSHSAPQRRQPANPQRSAAPNERLSESTDVRPDSSAQSRFFCIAIHPFCEAVQVATHDWIVAARDARAHYMFLLGGDRRPLLGMWVTALRWSTSPNT